MGKGSLSGPVYGSGDNKDGTARLTLVPGDGNGEADRTDRMKKQG